MNFSRAGLLGAFLSLFVLYFFLRNIQTTLMVSLAIPMAITITLGVMYFLGLSLNILSMMGLMLAVGMLVDNAVVVSESIHTEHEKTPNEAQGVRPCGESAQSAWRWLPAPLTSAAVFLPIIFGEKDQISIFLTHVATSYRGFTGNIPGDRADDYSVVGIPAGPARQQETECRG